MSLGWRVLYGLPPYGAMPEQFSATGQGIHREGFVVEFTPSDAPAWVGNFQPGMTNLDALVASRGDATVTVIAGGQAYLSVERLGLAGDLAYPCFLKPIVPKQFGARVFESFAELQAETKGLDDATELLRSESVTIVAEARSPR